MSDHSPLQQAILAALTEQPAATYFRLRQVLDRSDAQVAQALRDLVIRGEVTVSGAPGTRDRQYRRVAPQQPEAVDA